MPKPARLTLSVEETAVALGISRTLAYELVARRELPSIRLGRRIVVPRRALDDATPTQLLAQADSEDDERLQRVVRLADELTGAAAAA